MVKRLFSVVLVALATIPLWGANENTLTAESLVLPAGTTEAKLTVSLTNEAAISDIQFDLYLPMGFSIAYDEDDEARIEVNATRTTAKRHSVDYLEKTGFTRIMCTSSKGYTFSGNSGPVVDVYITKDASVAAGTYNVEIKNIAISNSENTYTPTNTTTTITVEGGGGGSPTESNSLTAATLSFEPTMTESVFSVELNNEVEISDIQFDLYLPTGFSIAYDEDDEARIEVNTTRTTAKRHSVDHLEKTGFTRIMCTSSKGYTFSGNSGPVVDVYITKDASVAAGTYNVEIKNIAISNSENTYTPADVTSQIVVPAIHSITYKVDGEVYLTETYPEGASITPIAAPTKEGYTFSGWDSVPSVMPEYDVDVSGTFTINQYTITFKVDGEVFQSFTQDYGTDITIPTSPTKEGYTFSGWQNVASTVPAEDVVYEATFTVNKYTLKFVADGTVVSETSVDYGSTIAAPNATAKTGYTFVTWGDVAATMPANDVTYTAQYSINQYTVTFKVDGEVFKAFTLDYGSAITTPSAPTKEGYTFSGWQNVASTVPAQNVTYEATFTVNKYTLKFVADGTVVSETSVDYGSTIAAPNAPAKTGYTFVTWGDVAATMPAKDVTYTAEYRINQYTVTFKVDGEVFKTFTQDYGSTISIPAAPTKEGYSFSGWQNVASTVPAQDVTYEANFTINKYMLKFVVDGTVVNEKSVDYGSTIAAPQAPAKTGYTFVTWGDVAATMPAKDMTYTAEYSINQYTITFKVDGEVYKTFTLDYGATITKPQTPTKEGYTFSGWQNVASTVPAQDVAYEANFTINKYTLKFVADGTVVSEKSVDYGSAITAPNAPTKTGYTFVNWGNVAATMPAKDVTYTAQYKVNQYKLTYMIDGRVYKTYTLDYDSVINPEGDAEDDDYYYGWEEIPDRMPDHDVTVNAYITGIAAAGRGITNGKYDIYSLDGKKLNGLQKGVNIIRYTNGTTKKVVIK